MITNAALQVTEQGAPPQSNFNRGKGSFQIRWIADDVWTEGTGTPQAPTNTGIVYNDESTLLNITTDVDLGTYTNAGADGALSFSLALPAPFVSDIQAAGEVGLFMTAIDPQIGFTFNSRSFNAPSARPFLIVSASAIDAPVITIGPADSTFECGSSPSLSVSVTGTTNPIYQWFLSGVAINEATNSTLAFPAVSSRSSGSYSVIVSNTFGISVTSSVAGVSVVDTTAPVVTLNGPASVSVAQHTFYSEPGASVTDGCASGLTASITGAVDSDTLGTYTLTYSATDSSGNTGSATREVIVFQGSPTVDTPPVPQTVNAGGILTLPVVAHAPTAMTYQWNKDGLPLSDGADNGSLSLISGATTSTLTVSNVLRADAANYSVEITAGATVSASAAVDVIDPAFDLQPLAQVTTVGSNVVFHAHAGGTPILGFAAPFLRYQWYKKTNSSAPATALAKQTNTSLTLNPIKATDQASYFCIVTNRILSGPSIGTGASNSSSIVTLTVYVKPSVSAPANLNRIAGNTAVFSVKAGGSGPFTYQWALNNVPLTNDGFHIVGATTGTITIINVQSADHGTYQCTVANLSPVTAITPATRGILTIQSDIGRPVANILHPMANARMTNGLVVVKQTDTVPVVSIDGTAVDKGLITNVNLTRTFPPWAPPISVDMNADNGLLVGTLAGHKLWTNTVTLVDGTNTFVATATDSAGLISTNGGGTRRFFLRTTNLLTVVVNGSGHTTPVGMAFGSASNNAVLENGRGYSINAVRNAGASNATVQFVDWRDGNDNLLTNGSTGHLLHFVMTNSLVLKANFNH